MAIEQGSVALRSPEEIMKERVGRVDQFFYMMRKNNAVIGESLDHIMHRGNKKRSHSHDYFEKYPEDATIAVTLGLQTNSKFIPLERVERMVGIFSQHKLPQEAPREVVDPKMDSILTRLDEMIPKDPRMPRAIIFSDPQDIAAFAVIESLINGSPNKKGERVIELFQNNPSYKEAEKLIVNINQHLSGKQKLVLYPIRKNRGEKKIELDAQTKLINMLYDLHLKSQKIQKKRNKEDKKLEEDEVTFQDLEDAMQKTRKNIILMRVRGEKPSLSIKDNTLKVHLQQKENTPPEFYGDTKILYDEALPFVSFLLNANVQKGRDIVRWLKKEGSNRIHFQKVQESTLQLIDLLQSKEQYGDLSFALADDVLAGDKTLKHLKMKIKQIYGTLRVSNKNVMEKELSQLPIIEAAARIFMVDQIGVLADEIEESIRARRSNLRTDGSDKEGFNLERQEKYLQDMGFGVLFNDPIREQEINLTSSVHWKDKKNDLYAFLQNDSEKEKKIHRLLTEGTTEDIFNLLIFSGVEKWSHSANNNNVWGGRKMLYVTGQVIDEGDPHAFQEYLIPNELIDTEESKPHKEKEHIIVAKSSTSLLIPITVGDSYKSDRVNILYQEVPIGSLQAEEMNKLQQ